jgi:hypothetical protein
MTLSPPIRASCTHHHEADIVTVHGILWSGISKACPNLHDEVLAFLPNIEKAGLHYLQTGPAFILVKVSYSASPSDFVVSPSDDFRPDGATTVAMVKSRSVIALFEPVGSTTWLM